MDKVLVAMLGHKSRSGKDTVYDLSGKELGFQRVAFADKLKHTVADLYGFTDDQMFGSTKDMLDHRYPNNRDKEFITNCIGELEPNPDYFPYFTPRRVLQLFGQDQRSINPTIWADYIFKIEIPRLVAEGHRKFMITDFRFRNEAKVAQEWESFSENNILQLVKVSRPGVESQTAAGDISENDLNNFEEWTDLLVNDSSLDILKYRSSEILTKFGI
jgi:hypothetical protein